MYPLEKQGTIRHVLDFGADAGSTVSPAIFLSSMVLIFNTLLYDIGPVTGNSFAKLETHGIRNCWSLHAAQTCNTVIAILADSPWPLAPQNGSPRIPFSNFLLRNNWLILFAS